jgi:methylenetetrahydrofolate dehydrogenase (NADP+)/methenyltetrahydrofolate cyclohydrolase
MTARIIDGVAIGQDIRTEIAEEVARLTARGIVPGLAVVLVGEDPASEVYVKMKGRRCEEAGMRSATIRLPDDTPEAELLATIDRLNGDPETHGMLVQLPLPKHMNSDAVIQRIDPMKDVDGFHPVNVGKVVIGDPTGFRPATPLIVGRPLANLLVHKGPGANATVTVCHSRTRDIASITRTADILVVAIGSAEYATADMVKPGAAVIDVGVNRVDDPSTKKGYRLVGDVAFDEVSEVASAITPVPGGVGPMTIAMLLKNTLQAAVAQHAAQ